MHIFDDLLISETDLSLALVLKKIYEWVGFFFKNTFGTKYYTDISHALLSGISIQGQFMDSTFLLISRSFKVSSL